MACIINSMACIINSTVFSHSNKFFRQILSLTVGFSHWLSHRGCWAPILTGTSRGICAKLLINVWGQGWLIRAEYESAKNSLVTCFRFNISSKLKSVDVPPLFRNPGCATGFPRSKYTAGPCRVFAVPPHLEPNFREQAVDKGDTLKLKIPYSGTGPFTYKLKKDNRDVPDSNDRVRIIPFDGYVILQIKG